MSTEIRAHNTRINYNRAVNIEITPDNGGKIDAGRHTISQQTRQGSRHVVQVLPIYNKTFYTFCTIYLKSI